MVRVDDAASRVVHRLPSLVRTRMTGGAGGRSGSLERVAWLTPYAADEIAQEARRAGPDTRLEVIVPATTSADGLAAVESLFGWLREKGIDLVIRREEDEPPGRG
jgi:hypothetical protein